MGNCFEIVAEICESCKIIYEHKFRNYRKAPEFIAWSREVTCS